jgi:ribose-phosphate pyrophosphokinase
MCKYVAYIIDTLNRDETISTLLNPVDRIRKLLENYAKEHADLDIQLPLLPNH